MEFVKYVDVVLLLNTMNAIILDHGVKVVKQQCKMHNVHVELVTGLNQQSTNSKPHSKTHLN
jgi:glycerol-3-phosphate responsive antiterminator